MDIILTLFKDYGIQALGWGIAIFFVVRFLNKQEKTTEKLTDNLTDLTGIVKVQQEQINNIKQDVETMQGVVFKVKYK